MTWHSASCCERCWMNREGEWREIHPGVNALVSVRSPVRVAADPIVVEECCFCGSPTISGIYVRADLTSCSHEGI